MPTGSLTLSPSIPPLYGQALQIGVYLYTAGVSQPFQFLPNVRCLRIDNREGPEPPVARFNYVTGNALQQTLGWPSQFETLWPIDAQGNYIVMCDDRIVVMGQNPDGSNLYLFDGFAQVPQVDVSNQQQSVTFAAVGVAARAYDDIIHTRVQRSAATPDDNTGASDMRIYAPCRFNPSNHRIGILGGYLSNAVAAINWSGNATRFFAVFLDPLLIERQLANPGVTIIEPWIVSSAVNYLIANYSRDDDPYVDFPTYGTIKNALTTLVPPVPGGPINANDTTSDCVVRDYDASGKPMVEAISDLLLYGGVLICWQLSSDGNGLPLTSLNIYRRDAGATAAPKLLYLSISGTTPLNLAVNNATQFHLVRDCNHIANAWIAESAQKQVEVSVVLAALFGPIAGDQTIGVDGPPATGRNRFFTSNFNPATPAYIRRQYRWYGADECGDAHWNYQTNSASQVPFDFSPVLFDKITGKPDYVGHYRPGLRTLVSRDTNGKPLHAVLDVFHSSRLIPGDPYVQIKQDTDTWYRIPHGWRLLDDRLGIELTDNDPEQWVTGNPDYPKIAGVSQAAIPGTGTYDYIWLRLTTVIEADQRLHALAYRRVASPTSFTRWRSADARDHFQYCSVSVGSINYPNQLDYNGNVGDGINPIVVRDDTKAAITYAEQLRSAHEFPPLAGEVSIPYITTYYQIGDRIQEIDGRNASLQTNIGADQGEAPCYAWVVGVSWSFEGDRQQTILQLSDRRAEVRNL